MAKCPYFYNDAIFLNRHTLETRRGRDDRMGVFKITHMVEGLNGDTFSKYKTDKETT